MSRKSITSAGIALTAICFVAGWLSYDWVLNHVTANITQRVIFTSAQEPFNHQLLMSLSFALVGAIIGFGALLSGRFSAGYHYGRSLLILLLVAAVAVSGGVVVLTKKITAFGQHLTPMQNLPQASLLLSEVRLYEIGIFGSGCILVMAIFLTTFPIDKSRKVSNHTNNSVM